jgi:hypothetical protein
LLSLGWGCLIKIGLRLIKNELLNDQALNHPTAPTQHHLWPL